MDKAARLEELRTIRDRMFAEYNQLLGMILAYEEMMEEDAGDDPAGQGRPEGDARRSEAE